jgi:hypothetical protein
MNIDKSEEERKDLDADIRRCLPALLSSKKTEGINPETTSSAMAPPLLSQHLLPEAINVPGWSQTHCRLNIDY